MMRPSPERRRRIPMFAALVLGTVSCGGGVDGSGLLSGSSVVVITLDTTRADALGCYGGATARTPNLDALAAAGVLFTQARSVTPVTLPSHSSLFTGQFPFEHGVRDNLTFRLPAGATTLAEQFRQAGYATGAIAGSYVVNAGFGLAQGFDVYSDVPRSRPGVDQLDDQRRANEVVDEALRVVRTGGVDPPFFLWVHFFDSHWPYEPPQEHLLPLLGGAAPESFPQDELLRLRYAAEVAFVDSEIGRLLDGLNAAAGSDQLLTVVVADHGEGLGDHAELTHGTQLYDTTLRIPLILNHARLPRGTKVVRPVSIVDVAPTVSALFGFDPAAASGADLSGLLDGSSTEDLLDRPVYLEACTPYYSNGWSPLFGLLVESRKLIEGPEPELYDVTADPGERDDIIATDPETATRARAVFAALAAHTVESERIRLDEEDRNRLAGLGYVGPGGASADDLQMIPGVIPGGLRNPREGLPIQDLVVSAFSARDAGDTDEAVRLMHEVVRLDPSNPRFLSNAADLFVSIGRPADALPALETSLQLREDAYTRLTLGLTLRSLGRLDAAIEALATNAELYPDDLQTRLALGESLVQRGDREAAIPHLRRFLALYEPRDALHYYIADLIEDAR